MLSCAVAPRTVAVVDIGSNSIKVLVATPGPNGGVVALLSRSLDARISAGISQAKPRLSDEGMRRGVAAVTELLRDAAGYSPARVALVATSAVRDAENGSAFRDEIRRATGHTVRILGGEDEAALIGRGLAADPALGGLRDFYVFDLGGGSLECLAFRDRRIEQAVSLQLGCVRLTEKFVRDPAAPLAPATLQHIAAHTVSIIERAGFRWDLAREAAAVGTGGTVATVRAILGAREGLPFDATSPIVSVVQLRALLEHLAALPLVDRQKIPGLPAARADVFPTALATLIAIAEAGGFTAFQNSLYNLRFGVAAELLEG